MPLAVDTNILARALTDDGSEHAKRASELLQLNDIFIADTVLLETEWLLRSRVRLPRAKIDELFVSLLSWPNIWFDNRAKVISSVGAHGAGLDFADAMHLFAAHECEAMITYDEDFIRRSRKIADVIEVRKP